MKCISFNINGLRARYHQLDAIINNLKPDIIGLQETKVDDKLFPLNKIDELNYIPYFYGQKQHAGVAILSKKKSFNIKKGLSNNPIITKSRIIIADYITSAGLLTVINCYCPNGQNIFNKSKFIEKKIFYKSLISFIEKTYNYKTSLILIMGDMNISPTDKDIGLENKTYKRWLKIGKCGFFPEERKCIENIFKLGFIDTYSYNNNVKLIKKNLYSWFDYRFNSFNKNRGLRIDLLLVSKPLIKFINTTGIDYSIRRMVKPSDHTPIWIDLNLNFI